LNLHILLDIQQSAYGSTPHSPDREYFCPLLETPFSGEQWIPSLVICIDGPTSYKSHNVYVSSIKHNNHWVVGWKGEKLLWIPEEDWKLILPHDISHVFLGSYPGYAGLTLDMQDYLQWVSDCAGIPYML
jgi:hypothetical protein